LVKPAKALNLDSLIDLEPLTKLTEEQENEKEALEMKARLGN